MITTTLSRIAKYNPNKENWEKLLNSLGKVEADDESLAFSKIVEKTTLYNAIWCCRAEPVHAKEWRLFAVWCARQVKHLMEDARSIEALSTAERYAYGETSDDQFATSKSAALAADIEAWITQYKKPTCKARPFAADTAWYALWDDAPEAALYSAKTSAHAYSLNTTGTDQELRKAAAMKAQMDEFLRIVTETNDKRDF